MSLRNRIKTAAQAFRATDTNSMGQSLSGEFLKFGNKKALVQDWSRVIMNDKEFYSGYPYAAIDRRANRVSTLGKYFLKTDSTPEIQEAAKKKNEVVKHPYLDILDKSKTFANRKFWYDISTYLDLEGVYYLFVLRNKGEGAEINRIGNPIEFKLLNPYNIRRIVNEETLEVGGYVETRRGQVREIPPHMIIEIRKLNPFDEDDPFAMTDAAKTAQFTLKQSGDYTRHSLKNNMAAPGIISTDVMLDPQQFANFVSRIMNQEKGIPLFGNGSGAITWDSMQIQMDKAGLKDISEIHRTELMAVSGVGKTILNIEESGTTRETAKVQRDLFTEDHAMPQIELILDALNQDYKVYYESEYEKNKYTLEVDNPLGTDRDAELKDIKNRDEKYKIYDKLVAAGYDRELASKYANGEIELEELGEPTNDPRPDPVMEAAKLRLGQVDPNGTKKKPLNAFSDDLIEAIIEDWLENGSIFNRGYNPYRDSDGRFGTGPSKSRLIGDNMSTSEVRDVIKDNNLRDRKPTLSDGDSEFGKIAKKMNLDGKPNKVGKKEFNSMDSYENKTLYRGVTSAKYKKQFESGDLYPSKGAFGSGSYSTSERGLAVEYSTFRKRAKGQKKPKENIVTMKLDKKSRVTTWDNLAKKRDAFNRKHKNLTASEKAAVSGNIGRFGALMGYDAFTVAKGTPSETYVILNRTKVTVLDD